MKSHFVTRTAEDTIDLGMQLAGRLKPGSTVLLFGELGSGKTHFAKGIAKGLGIDAIIKSPTFAYVNKYSTKNNTHLYHYDLYRLNTGDEFYSIGLEETLKDIHAINIVEWADRLDGIHPKDYIRVDFEAGLTGHTIDIRFEDSTVVNEEYVEKLWDDWTTPMHVRAHCKQVAGVALQIGTALVSKNILIDLNLLNTACLLHDMARVVDFTNMDRAKFTEKITDTKWEKWHEQRKQFKGMHHADVACGALVEDGYYKTGEVIRLHRIRAIMEESEKFSVLEVAILYYADKRVKHDEVVSLAERFKDGRERYGHSNTDDEKSFFMEIEKVCTELEQQIFNLIDLNPEDIK